LSDFTNNAKKISTSNVKQFSTTGHCKEWHIFIGQALHEHVAWTNVF